jgi:hypothetical protein
VPGGAERDALPRLGGVRVQRVVRGDQAGYVDEILGSGLFARSLVRHGARSSVSTDFAYGPIFPRQGRV